MSSGAPNPDAFIDRWSKAAASERANAQLFLAELADLLDVPRPGNDHAEGYSFEFPVKIPTGPDAQTEGRVDLYRRASFVLEAKQFTAAKAEPTELALALDPAAGKRKSGPVRGSEAWDDAMWKARGQAERYARNLPADEPPAPFLLVVDVGHSIEVFADFTQAGRAYQAFPDPRSFRIRLADLRDEKIRERLRRIWLDPLSLDPAKISAAVTREIAGYLAVLAASLEKAGHTPKLVAEFLTRCLFCMFAEDVGLLPKDGFRQLLESLIGAPEGFVPKVRTLFAEMQTGTDFSVILNRKLLRFNGGLFEDASVLPLDGRQLGILIKAATMQWKDVEPAIFGTLLERALDPEERHQLGAHYTPRAYVERLVLPTVIEPLRAEWENVRAAALLHANAGRLAEARAENRAREQQSNVLHSVTGLALKKEEMVKLPLNLHNAGQGDWKDTLIAAHGKLAELQKLADTERDETGRYVRPILLVRVERTGKDQTEAGKVHADHVRKFLHEQLGAKAGDEDVNEVAEKSSADDQLSKHDDLMADTCPVRFIITKAALQEGWDCPFAYVLAVLDETTAGTALTQMIGRILRQPGAEYFAESRAALNQSHVFVHRQNVADAVAKVREGLSSEGMGDLGELVRAAGTTSTGGNVRTVEVERRAPFRRRIFLPRILAREDDGWRLFDYESDLFPSVPWEALEWTKAAEFSPDDASSLAHTRVAVDVDQLGPDPKKPLGVAESGAKPDLDFPALARLLADVVPNPWQAARILRGALAALRARGFTEDQLLASRYRLIEKMRADLLADIHGQTERIFCELLASGELSFRLEGNGLNWELVEKLAFEVTQPPDFQITHKGNGQPVEKSLFEQIWSRHFNGLEKDVALYIDDVKAVRWWHRIAVQADWYLDGWKKKRVFPDFLVALEEAEGKPSKLVVVETKGLHLKNEDTDYKRKLFETLERHGTGGVPVGELTLGDQPGPMRFRLVLEGDWKSQVDAALAVAKV